MSYGDNPNAGTSGQQLRRTCNDPWPLGSRPGSRFVFFVSGGVAWLVLRSPLKEPLEPPGSPPGVRRGLDPGNLGTSSGGGGIRLISRRCWTSLVMRTSMLKHFLPTLPVGRSASWAEHTAPAPTHCPPTASLPGLPGYRFSYRFSNALPSLLGQKRACLYTVVNA